MTFDEVDRLPLLIRRRDVVAITGWDDDMISAYVTTGAMTPVRRPGSRKGRYQKYEVLRLAGVHYDSTGRVLRSQMGCK